MFRSFINVAIRNIIRQRAYALINVLGLAIGIACSILITLFIIYESSFDNFHENADRVVRIWINGQLAESKISGAYTAVPSGPVFLDEIPEVVNYCRIEVDGNVLIRHGDRTFLENDFYWADSGFFEIFTFPLVSGNPFTALTEPRSMVISEKMAKKYFGNENPMGRTLKVFTDSVDYRITGVMKDIPDIHFNTDVEHDMRPSSDKKYVYIFSLIALRYE